MTTHIPQHVAQDLLDLLKQAMARVRIANRKGNPILSAWLQVAEAALTEAESMGVGTALLPQETIDGLSRLEKGFMKPDFYFGPIVIDSEDGAMTTPDWLARFSPAFDLARVKDEKAGAWLARLSSTDCADKTDWLGPFDSEDQAVKALVDTFDD